MKNFSEFEDPAFNYREEMSFEDLQTVVIKSYNEAPNLVYKNWNGRPIVFCGLSLTDDNSSIENVVPVPLGKLPEKIFPAENFWLLQEKLFVKFEPLDLTKFTFNGSMTSELIDHGDIKYSIINKNGEVVFDEDLKNQGFLGFSLRLFLQPLNVTMAKISVLCYPMSLDRLKKSHPNYNNKAFPGMLQIYLITFNT